VANLHGEINFLTIETKPKSKFILSSPMANRDEILNEDGLPEQWVSE
jgi:hypothetical protein